jgi:ATP-dependent protease HslVU (ClpYQ) peptidase subunit
VTVIVWDGKTLAADKRSTLANLPHTTTKIARAGDGSLIGVAGDTTMCRKLREWYLAGADKDKYPDPDNKCDMVVITPDKRVLLFMSVAEPVQIEDEWFVTGSGRDFALSALHFGCDASKAVEFASRLDVTCGNGVDALTLEG